MIYAPSDCSIHSHSFRSDGCIFGLLSVESERIIRSAHIRVIRLGIFLSGASVDILGRNDVFVISHKKSWFYRNLRIIFVRFPVSFLISRFERVGIFLFLWCGCISFRTVKVIKEIKKNDISCSPLSSILGECPCRLIVSAPWLPSFIANRMIGVTANVNELRTNISLLVVKSNLFFTFCEKMSCFLKKRDYN